MLFMFAVVRSSHKHSSMFFRYAPLERREGGGRRDEGGGRRELREDGEGIGGREEEEEGVGRKREGREEGGGRKGMLGRREEREVRTCSIAYM